MSKRPYRLFSAGRKDWHMTYVASYSKPETAEAAAIKKLNSNDILTTVVDVMVVHADTGEIIFRQKRGN